MTEWQFGFPPETITGRGMFEVMVDPDETYDEAMMRIVDFLYGIPYMFLVILVMLMFAETARGVLDALVALGLLFGWKAGYVALYVAALSQIVVYTVLNDWIVDVPPEFALSDEQRGYLTGLVVFHLVTLALATACIRIRSTAALLPARNPGTAC